MNGIRAARMVLGVVAVVGGIVSASAQTPPKVFESAKDIVPLKVGDMIPGVMVKTSKGEAVDLKQLAARQGTVIVFYRGGWCPYCNKHLMELKEAMKGLEELGYQMLAISADVPEKMTETKTKDELPYTLLSDSGVNAAAAFGIAFTLDPATIEKYKGYGIDLSASEWRLPVPSVFISRPDGTITFVHADPDYTKRLSATAVLDAARASVETHQ